AHGRDQHPARTPADADPPRHHAADGADLWRALRRSRRPHPRHLRRDLAVRLGAPPKPAAAAATRLGESESRRGGEEAEVSDVATQSDVILRCALLRASKDGYGHSAAPPA